MSAREFIRRANYPDFERIEGDVGIVPFTPTGGMETTVQTVLDAFNYRTPAKSLKEFFIAGDADWTNAVTRAEASEFDIIYVPDGRYVTTLNRYQAINKRYTGPGQLVMDGKGQAKNRAFITTQQPVAQVGPGMFDGGFPKAHATEYTFIGSGTMPSVLPDSYRNFVELAARPWVFENAGGFNKDANDHALGRSGIFREYGVLTQNGQGDLVAGQFLLSVNSKRAGATHFLANPAVIKEGIGFEVTENGAGGYLNHSEYIYKDNGFLAAVIDRVRNYYRTNPGGSLGVVWGHDRPQSSGSEPMDVAYSPSGLFKRLWDTCGAVLGTVGAAFTMKRGEYIYFDGSTTDATYKFWSDVLGPARMGLAANGDMVIDTTPNKKLLINGQDHLSSDYAVPSLSSPWAAGVSDSGPPRYRKHAGRVAIEGSAKGGTSGTVIFVLPDGNRPSARRFYTTRTAYGTTSVSIWSTGEVVATSTATGESTNVVGLDGIVFDVI